MSGIQIAGCSSKRSIAIRLEEDLIEKEYVTKCIQLKAINRLLLPLTHCNTLRAIEEATERAFDRTERTQHLHFRLRTVLN